jgi:hypothetical protein
MASIVEADYPPLMRDQVVALRAYAREHGRSWKTTLRQEWGNTTAEPLLHQLRNSHGPVWLDRLTLSGLSAAAGEENHGRPC